MNIFDFAKTRTTWSNAEFIVFKLSITCGYLIIGTYFHALFSKYYIPLFIVFGISLVWTILLWLKKMRERAEPVGGAGD
jgi:hypothetical protein